MDAERFSALNELLALSLNSNSDEYAGSILTSLLGMATELDATTEQLLELHKTARLHSEAAPARKAAKVAMYNAGSAING